jgi:hypothetical protein
MKKKLPIFCFMLTCIQYLFAQDSIKFRVILIGDAGEINAAQKAILTDIVHKSLPDKTLALFLGDNVYPRGIETDEALKKKAESILQSQYEPLRKKGIPVYFIPGNHDWDKSGPKGYQKIMAENMSLKAQQDSLLKLIPENGCPGPYELTVNDNLVIITADSEWWLYPFDKHINQSDCICKTKRDILGRLEDILLRNKNKQVLFATHHPFKTYGVHGGYYTFKDHLFPLTNLNRNLYIPLPLIGSLYPLLRKTFPPAEDMYNAVYQDMKKSINTVLEKYPNVIQVSGHEHALQLIQGGVLQVVSGAGSKNTPVKKGKGSLYAKAASGYVMADVLKNNDIRFTYFTYSNGNMQQDFVYEKVYHTDTTTEVLNTENITSDSILISLKKEYDNVSGIHRNLFGENYRKIWALETKIPVLKVSKVGLVPIEKGGGMQTHSLRLADRDGKEWVIRSLDKFPDALLPQDLNQTLASDIIQDNFSAIFPYAPLTVPVFANALGVAHSNPSIVYVAPDNQLGIYSRDFSKTIVLFEEREPLGKSYSTIKMQEKLKEDNDNAVDQLSFLTARIQDIFLGDWDRHGDQWRWIDNENEKGKKFKALPRDRDQVFYINQGLLPKIASLPWIQPKLQGFGSHIKNVNTLAYNARFIDGIYTNALSYDDWIKTTNMAVAALSDSVIERALRQMPAEVYQASHGKLFFELQQRRQELKRVIPDYYRFLNKRIDIITSDKNEQVIISDATQGQLKVSIFKTTRENEKGKLIYSRVMDPEITKELRLYLNGGQDSVSIKNNSSPIAIRIVGDAKAIKTYQFSGASKYMKKISVYSGDSTSVFKGQFKHVHKHLSNNTDNIALQLTDRYNKTIPLLSVGFNADDGFILGGGIKWIRQGFRKKPYASIQDFSIAHSFSTNAYRVIYKGEWLHVWRQTDFIIKANAFSPDNTQNFFGRGNASLFDKNGDYKKFYRTRFDYFEINPALRWRNIKNNSFAIGPSFQYYSFDANDNTGRFINNTSLIHSYDSSTISKDKAHLGMVAEFIHDSRNNLVLPTYGSYVNLQLKSYGGVNAFSKSYLQLQGQIAFYKRLDHKSNIILANRTGGGFTAGNTTFYQSLFLGGHSNLQGYHQFRYAGDHMVYNNTEVRIKLGNLASYILPGQVGLVGFYDIGKVWQNGYDDSNWHHGVGGGFYFAPAQLFVFQIVAGKSEEGWYPYFTGSFRF